MIQNTDLAYLAGIIDGEGMVNMFRYGHRSVIEVVIANTNESIISRCNAIMTAIGASPYIRFQDRRKLGWKPTWWLRVRNQAKCQLILESVRPYIVGKLPQCDLLLQYIRSRKGKKNARLTEDEERMISSIRPLNKRG